MALGYLGSKINVINLVFALKLGLRIRHTKIRV